MTSQPPPSNAPGRPFDLDRENAILDAALEILIESGSARLTVAAVCERAGASTKTAYRRWPNKEELLAASLRRAVTRDAAAARPPADTGSLRDDLIDLLTTSFASFRADANLVVSLVAAARHPGGFGDVAREIAIEHHASAVAAILDRGRERHQADGSVDPQRVAGVVRGYFLNAVLADMALPTPRDTAAFVDDVLLPFITRHAPAGA